MKQTFSGAIRLSPDRFTPLTRTPWAGEVIARRYKNGIEGVVAGMRIGESWEFSCDPDFPSHVGNTQTRLADCISADPAAVLSESHARKLGGRCELLVKLLNACEPLSVQVHPPEGDPSLPDHECGKTESWFVLDADPGAGLYLGFRDALTRVELRDALNAGDRAKELLQFVSVQPGDYFEIAPGMVHAIGAGVTLLEAQHVEFGKSGKTWRLWDWGRRYDEDGRLDVVRGKPRALHLAEGLRVVDPAVQSGAKFVEGLRVTPRRLAVRSGVMVQEFPANAFYQLASVTMNSDTRMRCRVTDGYASLVMLEGTVDTRGADTDGVEPLGCGQPALIPSCAFPMEFHAQSRSKFALIVPAGASFDWK